MNQQVVRKVMMLTQMGCVKMWRTLLISFAMELLVNLAWPKAEIKNKVYCAEQNHPVEADQTSNGDLVTEI